MNLCCILTLQVLNSQSMDLPCVCGIPRESRGRTPVQICSTDNVSPMYSKLLKTCLRVQLHHRLPVISCLRESTVSK